MLNGHCATAAEPECLLEAWKGTKDVTPAAYNCRYAQYINRRNPKPSSRIERSSRERSAGVIRARAVNVKSSACDHRAVQCRLLLFVAEAVVGDCQITNLSLLLNLIKSSLPKELS
ncbi:Trans-activating transcriptional regulatory protein [Trichinella spiralis]|uniref:Trans-activating transcriptional regulatory protein n=1 Tax=Trichinella spiralis TaxID=6334 RepID=A0ABR3KRP9_TRISP